MKQSSVVVLARRQKCAQLVEAGPAKSIGRNQLVAMKLVAYMAQLRRLELHATEVRKAATRARTLRQELKALNFELELGEKDRTIERGGLRA